MEVFDDLRLYFSLVTEFTKTTMANKTDINFICKELFI